MLQDQYYILPVKTDDTNITYAENQEGYLPLPAHRLAHDPQGRIVITYGLTLYQRLLLLLTGKLFISMFTFNRPVTPIAVGVKNLLKDMYLEPDLINVTIGNMLHVCRLKRGTKIEAKGIPLTVYGFYGWDGILCTDERGTKYKVAKYDINITAEAALEIVIESRVCE